MSKDIVPLPDPKANEETRNASDTDLIIAVSVALVVGLSGAYGCSLRCTEQTNVAGLQNGISSAEIISIRQTTN